MTENLIGVSQQNMAFTDCMKPADLSADNKWRDWRNRLGMFLKTNSRLIKHRTYRPSADDVNAMSQSLDTLLCNKYGKAAFCLFLKSEFCEENIEFWLACEDFKTQTSHQAMVSKANSIYEEFIRSEAPKEINLDFHTKNAIIQSLQEPTATCFVAAQRKVYNLMENNSYPRFIHSELFRDLCQAVGSDSRRVKA